MTHVPPTEQQSGKVDEEFRLRALGAVVALNSLAVLAPQPAVAQQLASQDPQAVKAGSYKIEAPHTQVTFSISHFGFSNFSGQFSGVSGSLDLDPTNLSTAKLNISVPVRSVATTVPQLTEELKGAKWFDVAKFSDAKFVSTKVIAASNNTATIVGNFTLRGVTKPVTLAARLVGSGTNPLDKMFTVGFHATGSIKRSDYDIKEYLPLLGDDVALTIDAAFVLQP